MEELPQDDLNKVLAVYIPQQRVLKGVVFEHPTYRGAFLIGPTYYMTHLEHASDIEIQLCLNQLAYASVYQRIKSGKDDYLSGLDFSSLQLEGMFITRSSKKFRRQISTSKIITGEIELAREHHYDTMSIAEVKFQFEDRSCFGELQMAIKKT